MNTRPEPAKPDTPSRDTQIDTETPDDPALTDSQDPTVDAEDPTPETSVDRGG